MTWFIYAIAAPALWAGINHIDKYVVSHYSAHRHPGALVLFSSITSGIAFILIGTFADLSHLTVFQALLGMVTGALFVGGYIPYMYALQKDDVSITASLWQMIAPFSYILGVIFLHETVSFSQGASGALIIIGALLLTTNFRQFVWNKKLFFLMALASLMLALNTVIFKIIGLQSSFWTISFWEYLGAFIFGIILVTCVPSIRRDFIGFVRDGGQKIVLLNMCAESLNIVARLLSNFAALLAPIALVYAVNGAQPMFILVYSIILTYLFPSIEREKLFGYYLLQKIVGICVIVIGALLLVL